MAEAQIRDIAQRFLALSTPHGWDEFVADDYVMIRPTGDPVDKKGLIAMMDIKDVVVKERKCLDIHRVKLIGDNYAVVVGSEFCQFAYMGMEIIEVATHTMIFKKCFCRKTLLDTWKVIWQQRAVG